MAVWIQPTAAPAWYRMEWMAKPLTDTGFPELSGYAWVYVPFNALEALAWFGFAGFVWWRWFRLKKSKHELLYGLAFFIFGLTDAMEMQMTNAWLLLVKGMCLAAILLGRQHAKSIHPAVKF